MKKHLLTGLVILMPVALTLFIIFYLFDFFTAPFVSIVSHLVALFQHKLMIQLPDGIVIFLSRILSLILICALIFLLGIFGHRFFIKGFFKLAQRAIGRIPFISSIYKISRDIIAAIFSTDGKKVFKKAVMLPFPSLPNYAIGFLSGEALEECERKVGRPLVSVFAPTAPHPITGFLFLLPPEDIKPLDMTNEDAIKFLVSCGVILPASETLASEEDHDF